MLNSQKGFVSTLVVLLLLVAGIGLGTYLVGQKTNLFPKAANNAALPNNPFGMGAAFGVFPDLDQNVYRERQLQQTRYLAGKGGHVRLWCFMSKQSECNASIQRAYELELVPVILVQDGPFADDNTTPRKNYATYSTRFANFINGLPLMSGRDLLVELTNEPNFTDWWLGGATCDPTNRAKEIAQASAQMVDKVAALNKPSIKILGPALSPYGDSNPTPKTGGCNRGTKLDLPSTFFIKEMKKERPDLFTKINAWNSHPYPNEVFGTCSRLNCPPSTSDPLKMYRDEMIVAGVPSDMPVYLTEVGTYIDINSQTTADLFVNKSNTNSGIYPEVWLSGGQYNNVKGIMGFILPVPGFENYSWLDPKSSITTTAPFQTAYPIYNQVRALRIKLGYSDDSRSSPSPTPTVSVLRGRIEGPSSVQKNTSGSYIGTVYSTGNNLTRIEMYVDHPAGTQNWSLIGSGSCSGRNCSLKKNWTPTKIGSYTIMVNGYDANQANCTGNPYFNYSNSSNWKFCGSGSSIKVNVTSKPVSSDNNNSE